MAVRALPMWRKPVGLGANRTRTMGSFIAYGRRGGKPIQGGRPPFSVEPLLLEDLERAGLLHQGLDVLDRAGDAGGQILAARLGDDQRVFDPDAQLLVGVNGIDVA